MYDKIALERDRMDKRMECVRIASTLVDKVDATEIVKSATVLWDFIGGKNETKNK